MATTLAEATKGVSRTTLEEMDVAPGKRARLHRLLYEYGVGNGTLLILPIDQGIEHGPVDFFENAAAMNPEFEWELAIEGGYNGIACHWALARQYMRKYAGKVPLILKLNGRTNIPAEDEAFSTQTASVEDAVYLGADAIGYTLYVGSPRQDEDIQQFARIRQECERLGMPIIVWAYPRGSAIEKKGGRDSLYAVEYAARLAHELGADIIKLNVPKHGAKDAEQPKPYDRLEWDVEEGTRRVVQAAGRSMVLFSGGSKISDEDVIDKARIAMDAGATGLIFGRNMWQRRMEDALAMTDRIKDLLRKYPA